MKKLTSIIVDDELHGRENLKTIIDTYCKEVEVLSTAKSAIEGKELVLQKSPDIVFLDVNMPVLDGFDFLEQFDNRNFFVVIVSAHTDYGIRAVKFQADDYLLKPINIKELKQTIKKLSVIKKEKDNSSGSDVSSKIALPLCHGFEVFEVNDIIRFEADGCYTKVYMNEGKNLYISKTLKEFESMVPGELFYRVHKSHLINMRYVKEFSKIDGGSVKLKDGSIVEISRRKASDFIKVTRKMLTIF